MKDGFEEKAREVLEQVGWDPDEIAERVISRALRSTDSEAYERGKKEPHGDNSFGTWRLRYEKAEADIKAMLAMMVKKDGATEFVVEYLTNEANEQSCDAGNHDGGDWRNCKHCMTLYVAEGLKKVIAITPSSAPSILAMRDAKIRAEAFDLLERWKPNGWVDHACAECLPHGEILIQGFRCAYHKAKAAAIEARASGITEQGEGK